MPRGARRRGQIVAVAERMFLAHGFGETTMRMVAVEAGASKETLYRHFRSKEELFAEVVGNHAQRMRRRLEVGDLAAPEPIGDVLRDLGTHLLESMMSPEILCLMRMVVAESQRAPELGRLFYAMGPERTRDRLAEFFAAAGARGAFHGNPALAASIFLGAIFAQQHLARLILTEPPILSPAEIAERVDEVVGMFLQRYARPVPAP